MSDSAFKSAPYSGYTTKELEAFVAANRTTSNISRLKAEIARRAAVAAGDFSNSTDGERLRAVKAGIDTSSYKG